MQSVNLDNSDPKAGKVPTVQIDVCYDVSDVDVLDANGKSVVSPDRPDTGWIRSWCELQLERRPEPAAGASPPARISSARHATPPDPCSSSLALAAGGSARTSAPGPSYADTVCQLTDPATGLCLIWVEVPGNPGDPGDPGDDGPQDTGSGAACFWDGTDQGITQAAARAGALHQRRRVLVERLELLHLGCSTRSRPRATRAGRGTSPATARSTVLPAADRPARSNLVGRPAAELRRRADARARWRRSRSSR